MKNIVWRRKKQFGKIQVGQIQFENIQFRKKKTVRNKTFWKNRVWKKPAPPAGSPLAKPNAGQALHPIIITTLGIFISTAVSSQAGANVCVYMYTYVYMYIYIYIYRLYWLTL